jgi:mono/diheme cytochrome c family protein
MRFLKCGVRRWTVRLSLVLAVPAFILLSTAPGPGLLAAASQGETLYKGKCASCHGPDGAGQTSMGKMMKVNDLRSPEVQKKSDAELAEFIAKGKSPMPAYEKTLNQEQIKAVVSYLRELAKKK